MGRPARPFGARRGFTLLELLVVVAVIGVLMACIIPALRSTHEAARRAQCVNNLKQIALAMHNYDSTWGVLSPGYLSEVAPSGAETGAGWGWGAGLLPFLELTDAYNQVNFDHPVNAAESRTARSAAIASFACPSTDRLGPASFHAPGTIAGLPTDLGASQYVACGGTAPARSLGAGDGMFERNVARRIDEVTDGMQATIMIGERARWLSDASWAGVVPDGLVPGARHSTEPSWTPRSSGRPAGMVLGFAGPTSGVNAAQAAQDAFRGLHPGGLQVVLGDGTVRFLKDSIDPNVFRALTTRAGAAAEPKIPAEPD